MKRKLILVVILCFLNVCYFASAQAGCTFSAGINKDQALGAGCSKVLWNTKQFDECNYLQGDSSFRPGYTGKYMLIASCYLDDMSRMSTSVIYIYKNGSCLFTGTNEVNESGGFSDHIRTINCIVEVQEPADYFEVYVWHNSTMTTQIRSNSGTFFQGYRLSYY